MTDTVSPGLDRRTTKSRAVIFAAIRSVGQRTIAEQLGIAEPTLSEFLAKYGDRPAQILTACNLKPVPLDAKCVTQQRAQQIEEEMSRLHYWAQKGMAAPPKIELVPEEGDTGLHFE
jgi:hypothetical protein